MGPQPPQKTPHRPSHRFKAHERAIVTGQGYRQLLASHSSSATHKSTLCLIISNLPKGMLA